jgi:hypothetical protein
MTLGTLTWYLVTCPSLPKLLALQIVEFSSSVPKASLLNANHALG